LTEQFVLQQIICETPYTPYYYGTDKAMFEQDFPSRKVDSLFAAPLHGPRMDGEHPSLCSLQSVETA
jgi:hypothetical protein